jgi:hypothetical protein
MASNLVPKIPQIYDCELCDYHTSSSKDFNKHLLTKKHASVSQATTSNGETTQKVLMCENCNKFYNDRSGLWRHKNKGQCIVLHEQNKQTSNTNNDVLVEYLLQENKEIKHMIIELAKKDSYNNCNNTNTTHTNSHNKAFNLNFFLNETCKEAMNIGEFVDSLKIQLSDLEKVGEAGYIEGISNIIVKNLKELDITKRPVHCTDKKRETVYIKDEDKWEKDEDKSQMHQLIKRVVSKNVKMFPKFREAHPDCLKYHSKFSDQYNKIIYESMGGKGDNDFEKNEKIIKNVLKEVVVNKNI